MIINAKCTFDDIEQMEDRVEDKGNKNLEIQIIKSLSTFTKKEIAERLNSIDANINIVHLKLLKNDATNLIDFLETNEEFYEKIYSGFEFAENCALIQKKEKIGVVIHGDLTIEHFNYLMQNQLFLDRMNIILGTFPHTEILIENIMILQSNKEGNYFVGRGGGLYEPCDFAKILNKKFKTDRFRTVLDICHALSTLRIINHSFNKNITLEDFFANYKDTIGLIHLSYCKDLGFGKDHGLPYTKNEMNELSEFLELYNKYNYDCPVTIEVQEDNYHNAMNYLVTYHNLNDLLEEQLKGQKKELDIEKIVVNKSIIDKVKTENCIEFFEYLKLHNIKCALKFIDGYTYFKFYTNEGIVIVPEDSYIFINTSTKSYTVGYNCTFDIINTADKIFIK